VIPTQGSRPVLASRIYHSTGSVPAAGQIEISFMRTQINYSARIDNSCPSSCFGGPRLTIITLAIPSAAINSLSMTA